MTPEQPAYPDTVACCVVNTDNEFREPALTMSHKDSAPKMTISNTPMPVPTLVEIWMPT